jgi:hypothetical protein
MQCAFAAAPTLRSQYKPANAPIQLTGEVSISKRNIPVTLSLRDTDVKQVLRMLADQADST